ncbi:NAD(P)/FAD-dependent oxidoreductase, partial [Aspergillus undulatus]|uniref:NAD(P)/FAD-dependent oxidoreductase n=1 Tax=Aspergillus undulatus TaxID=1810928 RepID=UPI003CCE33C3
MTSQHSTDTVIIGGGIVGSALAHFLSSSSFNGSKKITLIDRSFAELKGSTGYAPGFIGQFNESEVLTRLAIDSVKEYSQIPGGFDHVGGVEIATSGAAADKLEWRCKTAIKRGLEAELISAQKAAEMAPDLVKEDSASALHFPGDGTASPATITAFFQSNARERGVELLEAEVTKIQRSGGEVQGVITSTGFIQASTVVLATGIWAKNLCDFEIPIPVIPVAHPYMYGEYHEPKPYKSPFVLYPEHHVYVRDHGTFFGLGSYNHKPLFERPKGTAVGDWIQEFDITLNHGLQLIPQDTNLAPREKFNGIFSMTPDNMPLLGSIPEANGLYMAAAVWVTHAAGSAKFLANMLNGKPVDAAVQRALDPTRFKGQDMGGLERESLGCYNSIYATHQAA